MTRTNVKQQKKYKYLDLIIYLNITMMAAVNVVGGKIIGVSIFTLSAASLVIPVAYIISDTITEVYGYRQARRVNWLLVAATVLLAIVFQLAVWIPAAPGFEFNEAYTIVLGRVPRIVLGTWVALFAGQFLNDFILAKMKVMTKGRFLWARTITSTLFGQAADTTSFYVIALYNVIPTGLLIQSILSGWLIKVMIEVAITPLVYFFTTRLKKAEGIDTFDTTTNFNPFIFNP